jgi:hypothetical protein
MNKLNQRSSRFQRFISAGAVESTPLISVSRKELTEIVRICLDAGANPNIARSDGTTALIAIYFLYNFKPLQTKPTF